VRPQRLNDGFRYTALGAFKDRITLLQPASTSAADGSPDPPVTFATTWAYIRALRSQEVNTADLVQSESFYDVRIPYLSGVTSQMTIQTASGRIWFIVNVTDPDQRQIELRILAREINDGVTQ
jgi:SPP1 family predicted phage head-tail adaptor